MTAQPEIISEDFRVHLSDGTVAEYLTVDNEEYIWRSDPAGTLYIYHKAYHKTFTTAVIKDERVASYAPHYWNWVEVVASRETVDPEINSESLIELG